MRNRKLFTYQAWVVGIAGVAVLSACSGSSTSEDPPTEGAGGQSVGGKGGSGPAGTSGSQSFDGAAGTFGSSGAAGSMAGAAGSQSGAAGSAGSGAGMGGTAGTAGAGTAGLGGAAGTAGGAGSGGCSSSSECGTGVCLQSGICCASAAQACGDSCCATSDVCLFGLCVTPGNNCQSSADCNPDEYCEIALGGENGGMGGAGGMGTGGMAGGAGMAGAGGTQVCTQPVPANGKCLPLPKTCTGNPTDPPDCLEPCIYKPDVAKLKATEAWSWGKKTVKEYPNSLDVWATPVVARIHDANCDGKVDELDPPNMVFVSGNTGTVNCNAGGNPTGTCKKGVLRMLDGRNGLEVWSLAKANSTSIGFATGVSPVLGDADGDGTIEIFAATGEGSIAVIDASGKVIAESTDLISGANNNSFGWGGALSIADMNHDGNVEIAFGANLFTVDMVAKTITKLFDGGTTHSGGIDRPISTFVDLENDMEGNMELLVGRALYRYDGSSVWANTSVGVGYPAVGDFDGDTIPEVALVGGSKLWILNGETGVVKMGPLTLPGGGNGGPPTVADFDGNMDKLPEIGVALKANYVAVKPDFVNNQLVQLWTTTNHDLSSSVTGSSVFDFEGDGQAEVIYNDECFLWVYEGATGYVKFAAPTLSFTATESSIVADVNGDGHAEMVTLANGIDPNNSGWKCNVAPWNVVDTDPNYGRPAWKPPPGETVYRGITVWRDTANSWVGTRTIWNEHTYHVSNVCDNRDSACSTDNTYGRIPTVETKNWTVPWLNNFRQNVQDGAIFNAADAVVDLSVSCTTPYQIIVSVKNQGLAILPVGVTVEVVQKGTPDIVIGTVTTDMALSPGQTQSATLQATNSTVNEADVFVAKIVVDPLNPTFRECNDKNNTSKERSPECVKP
jgi:hypothetical protein